MEVKAEVPPPPPPQPQRVTANNMKQQQAGKIANVGNGVSNQNQVKPEPAVQSDVGNQSFGNEDRKPFNQTHGNNQGGNRQNFSGRGGRGMGNRFGGGRGGPGGGGGNNRNFQQNRNQNQNQDVSYFLLNFFLFNTSLHIFKMAVEKKSACQFTFRLLRR